MKERERGKGKDVEEGRRVERSDEGGMKGKWKEGAKRKKSKE